MEVQSALAIGFLIASGLGIVLIILIVIGAFKDEWE